MGRIAILAGTLIVIINSVIHAMPIHEIGAGFGMFSGKPEFQFGYGFQGTDSANFHVSALYSDGFTGSFKAGNLYDGPGVYGGKGSPANTLALRHRYQSSGLSGRPLPWTISDASGSKFGIGLRCGFFDLLVLMDDDAINKKTDDPLLQKLPAVAMQFSSASQRISGGLAVSLANLERESYADGWGQGPIPASGGLFSTLSIEGRISLDNCFFETWTSLSAGILEAPGMAFSILGGWVVCINPNVQIHVFSFLSSAHYRNWLGKALEFDMVASVELQVEWEKILIGIDGDMFSGRDRIGLLHPTEASLSLRCFAFGLIIQGELQLDQEGLDSVSGRLGYRLGFGLLPKGRLDLSLTTRTGSTETYSAGFSLGWKLSSTALSSGKASMRLSSNGTSEGHILSVSGSIIQKFLLSDWGFASIGIKSPEGGYRLEKGDFCLPDASIDVSLLLPPT